jgi:hypothetical protein
MNSQTNLKKAEEGAEQVKKPLFKRILQGKQTILFGFRWVLGLD